MAYSIKERVLSEYGVTFSLCRIITTKCYFPHAKFMIMWLSIDYLEHKNVDWTLIFFFQYIYVGCVFHMGFDRSLFTDKFAPGKQSDEVTRLHATLIRHTYYEFVIFWCKWTGRFLVKIMHTRVNIHSVYVLCLRDIIDAFSIL